MKSFHKKVLFFVFGSIVWFHNSAVAAPNVDIAGERESVTISVKGITLKSETITNRSDKLELVLEGKPTSTSVASDDETVKEVRVRGSVLSIQLRHGRSGTKKISSRAKAMREGNGVVVKIPRLRVRSEGAKTLLHDSNHDTAAKIANVKLSTSARSDVSASAASDVAMETAKTAAKSTETPVKNEEKIPATNDVTQNKNATASSDSVMGTFVRGELRQDADNSATLTSASSESVHGTSNGRKTTNTNGLVETPERAARGAETPGSGPKTAMFALLILAGCGALWYFAKKKARNRESSGDLEIIATKYLGPKNRLVLVTTGYKNLLLSVNDKESKLLSNWDVRGSAYDRELQPVDTVPGEGGGNRRSRPSAMAEEMTSSAPRINLFNELQKLRKEKRDEKPAVSAFNESKDLDDVSAVDEWSASTSPSIAGIVRLKKYRNNPPLNVATEDESADAEWARELNLATRNEGNR